MNPTLRFAIIAAVLVSGLVLVTSIFGWPHHPGIWIIYGAIVAGLVVMLVRNIGQRKA
jgi:hypothetical protein